MHLLIQCSADLQPAPRSAHPFLRQYGTEDVVLAPGIVHALQGIMMIVNESQIWLSGHLATKPNTPSSVY